MNKRALVNEIALRTGNNKKVTNQMIDVITDSVIEELSQGNKVNIVGFGYFEAVKRPSLTGRNPRTGTEVFIPEAVTPKFRFSKIFKQSINN